LAGGRAFWRGKKGLNFVENDRGEKVLFRDGKEKAREKNEG